MLTISEMEEQTGLSGYTLRYYEREKIIIPKRLDNDHRVYSQEDVEWISFVKQLREFHVSIEEIRTYAHLMRKGDSEFANRLDFLEKYQCKIKEQMKQLQIVDKVFTKQVQLLKKEQKARRKVAQK